VADGPARLNGSSGHADSAAARTIRRRRTVTASPRPRARTDGRDLRPHAEPVSPITG
jgi:hypothetical protein